MNKERYKRQITFEQFGEEGQDKLQSSKVVIVGTGALGSIVANSLCRSGVGFLRLIDRDVVRTVNLQRQILFTEEDVKDGLPKAEAAARKLRASNSEISIEPIVEDVNSANIEALIDSFDLVMDCTDNFETRFLINEACDKLRIPWIYCGALASGGATMSIMQDGGPCFRCFMPDMPVPGSYPTCETVGVLGQVTGIVAYYAAAEAMKKLIDADDEVSKSYLAIDIWDNYVEAIEPEKNEDCPVCVHHKYEILDRPPASGAASICGENSWQIIPGTGASTDIKVDIEGLANRLTRIGSVKRTKFSLGFDSEDGHISFKLFPDGRAIIDNVNNEEEARAIYRDYISG